jgi:K+-transporting ATPase ATPase A chain
MDIFGWIQLVLFVGVLLLTTKPLGLYLVRILDAEGKTFLDPTLKPVERLLYRLFGLDPKKEQDWKQYTVSMLAFSLVGLLFTYAILRLQRLLPLNPQGFGGVSPDLAFNTAVSLTSRRWLAWFSITSSPQPRASPLRQHWCAVLPDIPLKRSVISGWTWYV